jgi:hypothetical protein
MIQKQEARKVKPKDNEVKAMLSMIGGDDELARINKVCKGIRDGLVEYCNKEEKLVSIYENKRKNKYDEIDYNG